MTTNLTILGPWFFKSMRAAEKDDGSIYFGTISQFVDRFTSHNDGILVNRIEHRVSIYCNGRLFATAYATGQKAEKNILPSLKYAEEVEEESFRLRWLAYDHYLNSETAINEEMFLRFAADDNVNTRIADQARDNVEWTF